MENKQIQILNNITPRLMIIRNQPVLLDRDIAVIFGVETKRINEAVRRNPDKFPPTYRFALQGAEFQQLVAKCDRFKSLKHTTTTPYAFTEKGLYMFATVLKSPMAVEATFEIIETFAQVRELKANLLSLHAEQDPEKQR